MPLVSYLAGYEVPRAMWGAVAVGLVGSTLVAWDASQVGACVLAAGGRVHVY